MRAYRLLQNGRELAFVANQDVGEACIRVSYSKVTAKFRIYHMRIEVERPGLPDRVYTFEPIDIIEAPEHL